MASLVELENGAPQGGRIDLANAQSVAGRPAAILVLAALQLIEHRRAIGAPGVATDVEDGLGVIVMDEFIAAKLDVAAQRNLATAILEPILVHFLFRIVARPR